MRLWSLHPQYLDTKGLLAVWREGLLAQKVIASETKGYKNHPQLIRFRKSADPKAAIADYLWVVHQEATRRGYTFNAQKILHKRGTNRISVSRGQIVFEWQHLLVKVKRRDIKHLEKIKKVVSPQHHPLFIVKEGEVEVWERVPLAKR